ncbi:MAG: hypothetical protein JNK88_04535 [Mangrovicoccus sp.]|nr:hypothetical protein [Mangrovicoccus sp.]
MGYTGVSNPGRAAPTPARVTQPAAWSLTGPMACRKAQTVVGPTKRQPRFFGAFESATDPGLVARITGAGWARV